MAIPGRPSELCEIPEQLERNVGGDPGLSSDDADCLTASRAVAQLLCRAAAAVYTALLRGTGGNVTSDVEHRPPLVLEFLLCCICVDSVSLNSERISVIIRAPVRDVVMA